MNKVRVYWNLHKKTIIPKFTYRKENKWKTMIKFGH